MHSMRVQCSKAVPVCLAGRANLGDRSRQSFDGNERARLGRRRLECAGRKLEAVADRGYYTIARRS